MLLTAAQRRFTTWLALWAVVLGALLPTTSQAALRLHDRADWIEVCTSTGMAWVKAETHDDTAPSTQTAGTACPWCLSPHSGPALPPQDTSVLIGATTFREHPPAYFQAARTDHVWCSGQARAPPAQV